jgi:hypothetical protein
MILPTPTSYGRRTTTTASSQSALSKHSNCFFNRVKHYNHRPVISQLVVPLISQQLLVLIFALTHERN